MKKDDLKCADDIFSMLTDLMKEAMREPVKEDVSKIKNKEMKELATEFVNLSQKILAIFDTKVKRASETDRGKFISAIEFFRLEIGDKTRPIIHEKVFEAEEE